MIKCIAVLLTCHNRKDKTVSCLDYLFEAYKTTQNNIKIKVYLTDDGSSDGTSEIVKKLYPETVILKGDGNLFWTGGMRNSWKEALKYGYDAYLLLNDDTTVYKSLFNELILTHEYVLKKYNCGGIYIGSTQNLSNKYSYGGSVVKNKFLNTLQRLEPNGSIQKCEGGNANIMMVSQDVVTKIGILSNSYTHGIADYDYTLTAKRNNIPVFIAANYCGICDNDNPDTYQTFLNLCFSDRRKFLYDPKGLAFFDYVVFNKKFFPYRLPFIIVAAWIKLFFPKIYIILNRLRK